MVMERMKTERGGGLAAAIWSGVVAPTLAAILAVLATVSAGCSLNATGLDQAFGGRTLAAGQPHPEIWAAPDRWVLIHNPRYREADDPMGRKESPYVWAEKEKLPLTINRAVGGTQVILAPPDIQEKYAPDKVPPRDRP